MTKVFVEELKDKDAVDAVFLVRSKNTPVGKTGKSYLAVVLADKTGHIDGRAWDNIDVISTHFQVDDFVRVKGSVNVYQNRRQVIINQIAKVPRGEILPSDFLKVSTQDSDVMLKTLLAIVNGMKNKYLKSLCLETLEDPEIQAKYIKCPAARTIHHAWIGGLLEHTLSICKIMLFLSTHYEGVDLDMLIVGAIFHDIGKIWELSFDNNISYTNVGKLVGHLVMGSELIEKKASGIKGFPDDLKILCKHLVLSHHGKLEYGSPKLPMTLEALIVSFIDDFDSKVNALQTFLKQDSASSKGESWTGHNQIFERYFFKPGEQNP
jgi:3'-5' exoribonuclease